MSKHIKITNYKNVSFDSEEYTALDSFTELSEETGKKGEIRIIDNGGNWNVGVSKTLYSALGEPHFVKVLVSASQIAFRVVPEGTPGAYEFCKGHIIYSTALANRIMSLAVDTEFKSNVTTRCGHIQQVQMDEDGFPTVIIAFD